MEKDWSRAKTGDDLTEAELRVLQGVSEHGYYKVVANTLGIAKRTVEIHMQRIYIKLGVTDKATAVAAALRSGVIK